MATLPVSAIAQERARDVGLVTQGWLGWAGDVAKSEAIGALFAAAGGALLIVGMRRFGRRWWIPGAATVVAFGVIITYAGPVVLDPVFNKFKRLPAGETRSDVLALAKRAGVDVGEVYEIDASRRTSAANAYVNGLGHTKRVVLYDNLLRDFTPAEVRLVVAHELGHVQHRDVPRGLLYLAIVAPFGMFAVARLGERLAPRDAAGTPLALPAVVLAVALVAPTITVISNQLSRAVERSADGFALELTREPETQIAFQRKIAIKNVSDPDPPDWVTFLLGTHPPTIERIGQAASGGQGVVARGVDAEAPGQVGDLEQPPHGAVERHHEHRLARRLGLRGGVHDRAERGRVDEVDLGEVEHDARLGAGGRHRQDGGQARGGGEVELAGGGHEQRALDGVEVDGVAGVLRLGRFHVSPRRSRAGS